MILLGVGILCLNSLGIEFAPIGPLLLTAIFIWLILLANNFSLSLALSRIRVGFASLINSLFISRPLGLYLAKFSNRFSLLYISVLLFISSISSVTNGDAQTYNVARVASAYLAKKVFLTATSVPTQAFHSFGHDYIFAPDIAFGNIAGLSLVGLIEVFFLLVISDFCIQDSLSGLRLSRLQKVKIRAFSRIFLLSIPPLFFQANNVKNDIVIVPLAYCVVMCAEQLFYSNSIASSSRKRPEKLRQQIISLCRPLLAMSLLLLYVTKAYGLIISLPSIFLIFFSSLFFRAKNNLTHLSSEKITNYDLGLASGGGFVMRKIIVYSLQVLSASLVILIIVFEINKYSFWREEYSKFVAFHGPDSFLDGVTAFPLTLIRVMTEALLNVPSPIKYSFDKFLTSLGGTYLTTGGPYEFGQTLNQDIAWPGFFFNALIGFILISLFALGGWSRLVSIYSQVHSRLIIKALIPYILLLSAFFSSSALIFKIYWQPAFSRYLFAPALLSVPALSIVSCLIVFSMSSQRRLGG